MTPEGFLMFIAEIRGFRGADARARVADVVKKVSLEGVMHQPIETLSKGYKRRVGLAQAILHDPQVLVLDEPTDGLDPNQKHEVRGLIRSMCTRVIIIANGRAIVDCTPDALAAKSRWHNAVRVEVAKVESLRVVTVLRDMYGATSVEELSADNGEASYLVTTKDRRSILGEISQRAQAEKWKLDGLHVEHGRLDEVFRDLTKGASPN
jgi:ABC-2 type transport system ATP-binding protein